MNEVFCKLTVLFEEPFWVGIFERILDNRLSVAKVTFGAEPKDYEIYEFILQAEYQLQYSPMVDFQIKESTHNPKRIQREAKKQMECTGVGTKSQQALKLLQEQNKQTRKVKSRARRLAEEERLFSMKQQKRKEKHRGH